MIKKGAVQSHQGSKGNIASMWHSQGFVWKSILKCLFQMDGQQLSSVSAVMLEYRAVCIWGITELSLIQVSTKSHAPVRVVQRAIGN